MESVVLSSSTTGLITPWNTKNGRGRGNSQRSLRGSASLPLASILSSQAPAPKGPITSQQNKGLATDLSAHGFGGCGPKFPARSCTSHWAFCESDELTRTSVTLESSECAHLEPNYLGPSLVLFMVIYCHPLCVILHLCEH